jgi:polyhydroxybutyrate depolymerase
VDRITGTGSSGRFGIGRSLHDIVVGQLDRTYELHVPHKRPTSTSGTVAPYPLIIVLHGSSGSGDDIRATTNMDSISEARHWIAAYPDGVRGEGGLFPSDWNAGTCCGAAGREGIDDVAFIKAVIAEISAHLPVDKTRIYVAGFSDGGRMAHRLGCELTTTIAAIGVVSGSMKDDACTPSAAMPIIAIHGTADDIVPYDEPSETAPPPTVPASASSLPPSVQYWIAKNGCSTAATAKPAAHVARTAFTGCTGAPVTFYAIAGGVHTWPVLTPGTSDPDAELSATSAIAAFFAGQARK